MKKLNIANKIMNPAIGTAKLRLEKHSPEILLAAGIVGMAATVVTACKATIKAVDILNETKETLNAIHTVSDDPKMSEKYTEEDNKHDLTTTYIQTGIKLVKVYAPSIIFGALSITSLLASSNIMRKRNAALAAAYATVDKGFKSYRNRVSERFGEDVDRELRYDVKAKEIQETVTNENGEEVEEKKVIETSNVDEHSDYARFFDSSSRNWTKDPEFNLMFLKSEESYANDRLRSRGYLFLNEVYERLDIPVTKAGQCVGWIYRPEENNFVDFGIYETGRYDSEAARRFVNGYEPVVLLDFNVEGDILNMI